MGYTSKESLEALNFEGDRTIGSRLRDRISALLRSVSMPSSINCQRGNGNSRTPQSTNNHPNGNYRSRKWL